MYPKPPESDPDGDWNARGRGGRAYDIYSLLLKRSVSSLLARRLTIGWQERSWRNCSSWTRRPDQRNSNVYQFAGRSHLCRSGDHDTMRHDRACVNGGGGRDGFVWHGVGGWHEGLSLCFAQCDDPHAPTIGRGCRGKRRTLRIKRKKFCV